MGAEGSRFEPGCPDFLFMNAAERKLPYLTFFHRPCRGYTLSGDGEEHIILSPEIDAPVDFSSLILSVHYRPTAQSWLLSEVQIRQNGVWGKFFKLALYSTKLSHSFDEQEDEFAKLSIDVLRAKIPAQAYRFRLTLHGEVELPDVAVCLTDASAKYDDCAGILPPGQRKVEVRPISQMRLDVSPTDQIRLCSPTSLTMALNALGVQADALETAAQVYDDRAHIYGNWCLNTAYAYLKGCDAVVTRFQRLIQLADFVNTDGLVLATIGYKRGELTGAAVTETPGHLVVICGWENGKILVADPAASITREVIRFYDGQEFARAWLQNKRGAAYLVRKL